MVTHTFFTSLESTLQTRLAQECIPAIAITGQTFIRGRARIVAERQREDSQDSDFTAWVVEDNKLSYVKPAPCRILIITSVGTAGINLYRANHMIVFDHFVTHQEMVQTVGSMARKGQPHECIVDLITVHTTVDDRMFGLSESKGLAASALFGRVDRIMIQTEDGESWELGQDNPLAFQADTVGGLKKAEESKTKYIQNQSKRRLDSQSEIPLKSKPKALRVDSPSRPEVDETDDKSTVAELDELYVEVKVYWSRPRETQGSEG